jgi:hypothetical protein
MKQEFQKVQQPHNMDEHQDLIQIILKKLQKNKNKIKYF